MKLQFIGDGGHSKVLKDICLHYGIEIVPSSEHKVLAFGALDPEALEKRFTQADDAIYPCLIHNSATCSNFCYIGEGTQILPNAVVNRDAKLGKFCIINSGAIIEHDVVIGNGCHIAPGAVVLGGAKIGEFSFIGANATVIQGAVVPPRTFVKAGSAWK